jgi:hypothetical protein
VIPCEKCGRHIRVADASCPFCASRPTLGSAQRMFGAAMTTFVLAACYGTGVTDKPGHSGTVPIDTDTDTDSDTDTDTTLPHSAIPHTGYSHSGTSTN